MSISSTINSSDTLLNVLRYSQDATLLYTSDQLHVGFVNDAMLRILNKSKSIEGQRLEDFAPEFAPYFAILKELWRTGEDMVLKDSPADIDFEGKLVTTYFDIEYRPVKNDQGQTIAIINTAREVTERMLAEQLLEEKQASEQALIKKLKSSNEEIIKTQQQLQNTNLELQSKIKQLSVSEQLLNRFIMEAPAGLALMRGPDYIYTIHNAAYQAILPGRQLLGRSFFDAVSELKGTPIEQVLHDVYHKGITHSFSESLVPLSDYEGGPTVDRYFTFNYLPWLDDKGEVDGILNLAVEVTEAVNARKAMLESIERFEIAIDAGNFGTTEVDLATGVMTCNERFKSIFGKTKDEDFAYHEMFEAMLPQYREIVRARSMKAREDHSLYEATYQIKWPDGSIHWVEAHGRGRYDKDGNPDRMVGILADVTEQKAIEQRKNDFIGMVSHELKTPITSLNAYLQMLRDKANRAGDNFTSNALERSVVQVKKMTTMINGFLNVSRLESGKLQVDLQRFDMAKLIKETEEESIVAITSHKVIFAPVVETIVTADKDKIGNVINNLMSNAVKYSPNGSTIHIACVTIDNNAQVSVKDEGVGIAAKDTPKLFDRYYRTETATNSSTSGFGIGLYLSAEIIGRHHGKIWVESELGKGSTFYFSIPLHL